MRSVGLDLGARHIAYCEVSDGVVMRRASVRRFEELEPMLGPKTAAAQVALEASREGWHVHDVLAPPIPWRPCRSWRFILSRRLQRRKRCAPNAANAP